jgi:glycosyltransferase involved in cell wall biosynthesis
VNVLALAAYPERIASTRFRVSVYLPHLANAGMRVELVPWLDDGAAANLYREGGLSRAARNGVRGVARQLTALRSRWDVVWIQREAMLAGPPIVEALARTRAPVVVDYDDAVWIAQGGALKRFAKFAWKFDWVLRRASHAIAGSKLLAEHARTMAVPVTVVPTTVERELWKPPERAQRKDEPLCIGWIGTHSTAPQLDLVAPALRRLRSEGHHFRVVVIGAGVGFSLVGLDIETRAWRLQSEISDFRSFDIDLAPMHTSPWHEGKCGFKQIQYMAVGVPCVSSLVGGARDFVVDGQNALVAATGGDWYAQLRRLITEPALRSDLARRGRELIENRLCVEEQAGTIAHVLRTTADHG